jgi:hypothetical protein
MLENSWEPDMKFVFLDIDGVLNSAVWLKQVNESTARQDRIKDMQNKFGNCIDPDVEYYAADIDPEALKSLRRLWAYHSDTKIVISSSWRQLMNFKTIKEIFKYLGWSDAPIIDSTPTLHRRDIDPEAQLPVLRGHEIKCWLETASLRFIADKRTIQPTTFKYLIFDDDSDFLDGQPLIQTSWETGLKEEHVQRAIKMLT